jgi:D-glycero-alpha-D-manno-heptose-7-phosphate kinase
MVDLYNSLLKAQQRKKLPKITAYNRIDGPGSSLDLREFQQSFWKLPANRAWLDKDPTAVWSKYLPRTVGLTIDVGVVVEAHPLPDGKIGVESTDYGTHQILTPGRLPYHAKYWLARILETLSITGVLFKLHNIRPGIKSSGLGGSAAATTAVCMLANQLSNNPFSPDQLIALASLIEQDMGVSLTGTQEQANVLYGGVTDYIWFPWGIPGTSTGFGSSVRYELLAEDLYPELESRILLLHTGTERASTDVNSVFRQRLSEEEGYRLHRQKLALAYDFREGIRTCDWPLVSQAIREYRKIRVKLCADYMTDKCWDIQGQCEQVGAESFPLGAGGGGAVLAFSPDPDAIAEAERVLSPIYRTIEFRLRSRGHQFENIGD